MCDEKNRSRDRLKNKKREVGWRLICLFRKVLSESGEASETEWRIVKDKLHTSRHVFPIKCPSLREYQKEKRGERERIPLWRDFEKKYI